MSGYGVRDRERWFAEAPKQGALAGAADWRGAFARDRARVLHSAALRRLAGKTQVVGPAEGAEVSGVPRTRLTHSLEVAQIGREIAEQLGADPDLVETAGLAHDIGHPPFGHNGEQALDEVAQACGGFEGNAQTLRILTRLEPKVLADHGQPAGLNLTRACLDAAMKYPWPRTPGNVKYGVYPDDLDVFRWIREDAPEDRTCLEAQIMDWSDDVAYSVHDLEDGVLAGRISLSTLADPHELAAIAELATRHFVTLPTAAIQDAAQHLLADLLTLPSITDLTTTGYDSSIGSQVALKRLTSELVGRFTSAAVASTQAKYGTDPLLRYQADLVVPDEVVVEVALCKALALRYVMQDPDRLAIQREQRKIVKELVQAVLAGAPDSLTPMFHPAWQQAADEAARLRIVIDQVSTLTDAQALAWHAQR